MFRHLYFYVKESVPYNETQGFENKPLTLVPFSKGESRAGEFIIFLCHLSISVTMHGFEWMPAIRLPERAFACWVLGSG